MKRYFMHYFYFGPSAMGKSLLMFTPSLLMHVAVSTLLACSGLMLSSLAQANEKSIGEGFSATNNGQYQRVAPGQKPRLNVYANDFTLKSHHGDNIRLDESKGNVVLIEFWSSWSGSSIRHLSESEKLYQAYKDKGFKALSVNIDPDKSQRISAKLNPEHSILFDYNKAVSRLYGINTIPTFLVLDKTGKVALVLEGVDPRYPDIIKHKIERMLGQE